MLLDKAFNSVSLTDMQANICMFVREKIKSMYFSTSSTASQ